MQLQLANFVRGRLSAGITAAATSIPLTTAAFPALAQGAFCYAVLQSAADRSVVEIVKVTAGGATLTVERGQEGTTARDFAANDIIEQRLTAVQFQSVVDHSNDSKTHVPSGVAGKFLKGVVDGAPVWGMPTASEVGAVPTAGGDMTGPLGVKTLQGQGSSIPWGSLDISGSKGGYAGINFSDTGHWFGILPTGLSGVWKSDGNSKWYFNESGVLTGGAKILWDTIIDQPSRTNWASKAYVPAIVTGQLAWKNYGNGHTIFDASAGTSPDGTAIDKTNAQVAWGINYPVLMGWNGTNTYGLRVDSARTADSAGAATTAVSLDGGTVKTSGQDLTIHGKRAMVGVGADNQLFINYGGDWGSTAIVGQVYLNDVQSGRHVVINNGSTNYANSGLELRSTDGSEVRLGMHRAGHSAGAIRFAPWGFVFEREASNSNANVAAGNFFANDAQSTDGNALTRKDYVDGVLSSKFDKTGGTVSGDITINTYSIRGVNGAAIVKDHGNGNTTFSGSRNASSVAGDLYLGYHDNANHFTNKIILCRSMYSDANQNLQIVDYSNGALFDKGAAVIGANRDNILNNPSFGVGFLSAADSGAQWIASYFGKNGGANQVVVGELAGGATIGGHNAAKTAWADLYIGTQSNGGGNNITHISMPYARMQGNANSYEVFHRGNFNPDTKLSENGHYGGTLKLNNWFRSVGDSGWYSETHGGGIHMDEATTVKVYNGKKFSVANTIGAKNNVLVDALDYEGSSFDFYRYNNAVFDANFGGLNVGSFAPIVGSYNSTNGYGYGTRIHLGALTPGATGWSSAALIVGSAESNTHPLGVYTFDAYGNVGGISGLSVSGNATIGNDMICNYAYANGAQPLVPHALTRKDYVDEQINTRAPSGHGLGTYAVGVADCNTELRTKSGFYNGSGVTGGPNSGWNYYFNAAHGNLAGFNGMIAMDFGGTSLAFKAIEAGTDKGWKYVYHTGNKPTAADVGAAEVAAGEIVIPAISGTSNAALKTQKDGSGGVDDKETWITDKPTNIAGHKGIGIKTTLGPVYWNGNNIRRIYNEDFKPTAADVGLGNVPNTVHSAASTGDTVAVRDSSGDLAVRLLRPEYGNQSDMNGAIAFRNAASGDNYLRFCSNPSAVRRWLQVGGDRFAEATTLYTGSTSTHPTNNAINLPAAALSDYRQIRFELCNSGNTIVTSVTLSYDAWAAMCASGKSIFIASGGYSYTFEPAAVDARTLYRNTSANCYLTKIVGIL